MTPLHVRLVRKVVDATPATCSPTTASVCTTGAFLPWWGTCVRRRASASPSEDEGQWSYAALTASHRVTPPMAEVVNALFPTSSLSSARAAEGAPPVRVHACGKWKLGAKLVSLVEEAAGGGGAYDRVLVLASTKAGNAPLRAALNLLSARGVPLYVQGHDGMHADVRARKASVPPTTPPREGRGAVVVLADEARSEPLYVRARARRAARW